MRIRSQVYKDPFMGDWIHMCAHGSGIASAGTWSDAMEMFWGHEAMCHSACPDCDGTGCVDCRLRWAHDDCYCLYCYGTGVVCSS